MSQPADIAQQQLTALQETPSPAMTVCDAQRVRRLILLKVELPCLSHHSDPTSQLVLTERNLPSPSTATIVKQLFAGSPDAGHALVSAPSNSGLEATDCPSHKPAIAPPQKHRPAKHRRAESDVAWPIRRIKAETDSSESDPIIPTRRGGKRPARMQSAEHEFTISADKHQTQPLLRRVKTEQALAVNSASILPRRQRFAGAAQIASTSPTPVHAWSRIEPDYEVAPIHQPSPQRRVMLPYSPLKSPGRLNSSVEKFFAQRNARVCDVLFTHRSRACSRRR